MITLQWKVQPRDINPIQSVLHMGEIEKLKDKNASSETTDELNPLKGLTRLLTLGMDGRDMRVKAQESYSLWEEITRETPRELD